MTKILLGKITEPIGLRGLLKVHLYSDTPSWLESPVYVSVGGADYQLVLEKYPYNMKSHLCAFSVPGKDSRLAILDFLKQEVWTDSEHLPALDEDEFYCEHLIGLQVMYHNQARGYIKSMQDYGSGCVMELDSGEYIHWCQVARVCDGQVVIKDTVLDE